MHRLIIGFLAVLALSACSTNVVQQQAIAPELQAELKVSEIKATLGEEVIAPADFSTRLESAVQTAVAAKSPRGLKDVKLNIRVTKYEIASSAARFFVGMLAGSNKLFAIVEVVDIQSNSVIGKFGVQREANPGGYGAFYDQEQATIQAAADGIADTLYPPQPTQ